MKRNTPQQIKRSKIRLAKMYARRNFPQLKSYMKAFYEANKHYRGRTQSMEERMRKYATAVQQIENNWLHIKSKLNAK